MHNRVHRLVDFLLDHKKLTTVSNLDALIGDLVELKPRLRFQDKEYSDHQVASLTKGLCAFIQNTRHYQSGMAADQRKTFDDYLMSRGYIEDGTLLKEVLNKTFSNYTPDPEDPAPFSIKLAFGASGGFLVAGAAILALDLTLDHRININSDGVKAMIAVLFLGFVISISIASYQYKKYHEHQNFSERGYLTDVAHIEYFVVQMNTDLSRNLNPLGAAVETPELEEARELSSDTPRRSDEPGRGRPSPSNAPILNTSVHLTMQFPAEGAVAAAPSAVEIRVGAVEDEDEDKNENNEDDDSQPDSVFGYRA